MSLFAATVKLDVRLQARSKLYTIGMGVAILMGLIGRFLFSAEHAGPLLAAFYLLGIGGTTYVFSASLVLLDKSQGTLQALQTTPLTSSAYISSKVVTLTAFAMLEGTIVYAVAFADAPLAPWPLATGVFFLGAFYTLVGLGQVASHHSVLAFLMPGALVVGSLLQLPVLYVLGVGPPMVWHLIPTQGPVLLMLAASEPLSPWQWAYAIGVSAASLAGAGWWARHRFRRHIALQDG